jgi:hypothetical protein
MRRQIGEKTFFILFLSVPHPTRLRQPFIMNSVNSEFRGHNTDLLLPRWSLSHGIGFMGRMEGTLERRHLPSAQLCAE